MAAKRLSPQQQRKATWSIVAIFTVIGIISWIFGGPKPTLPDHSLGYYTHNHCTNDKGEPTCKNADLVEESESLLLDGVTSDEPAAEEKKPGDPTGAEGEKSGGAKAP